MKSATTRFFRTCLIWLAVFSLVPVTAMAESFPTKPITMIVPYKAGGSTDTMARVLAKALKTDLGQPVIVVNRTGAGGSVGATYLKNSDPDGYTMMMGSDEIVTWNPLIQSVDFKREDFRYIAAIAEYQNALVTLKDKPYTSLAELISWSKDNPGVRAAYQSPLGKTLITKIAERNNLDWTIVSTTGGGEAMQFLLGDKIDITYSGGIHNQYREQMAVLASLNSNRLAADPGVSTLKEMGYGLAYPSYIVFMTPAGVPEAVAGQLESAILKASQTKDFKTIVEERLKSPVIEVGAEELTAYMENLDNELKAVVQ